MQQFICGFIVGTIIAVLAAMILYRKKKSSAGTDKPQKGTRIEELSKLTGQVAHEIKNPLSTIKINLKLIDEELTDLQKADADKKVPLARASRKLSVVQSEAQRLENILDGFLTYVDQTPPHPESADLNELVSDVIDFYTPQAYAHNITIRQSLAADPLVCKIDTDMLKQVMLNLFINAQQAMSTGGELMIRTEKTGDKAVLHISDTGLGIEPEKVGHIFEAYYSSRPNGKGLGLPTAKRIIEKHKGKISVTSEQGKGTYFTIELPLQTRQ